ncbi:hypothetical protein F0L74_10105 [Chitinophaga agrisoli]|uniref:DUF6265 domain-containing protein n=1 Tax=Chitinophaga agrisoli TaxID=2607653 RepID=A0A5B2VUF9_9BACT|nr:DUF6265 family protein [Chitinophaga agrisoli]KAA2242871.1 hypothetical protein F0L74_10105 [Chitinophaga agrisoli]
MDKKRWYNSSLFLLIILLSGVLSATGQVKTENFRYLTRLVGTWEMRTRESMITEQWSRVNDSTFEGRTWRIVNADSVLQETMQLIRSTDAIYYIPTIKGQNNDQPVRFKLQVLKPEGFIAENPAHDFPKKITYRLKDERHLDAKVEGKQGNTYGEIIFQYKKKE